MSIPCVVFIVLLVLKLTGLINWSWWLVTAPFWGYVLVYTLFSYITKFMDDHDPYNDLF